MSSDRHQVYEFVVEYSETSPRHCSPVPSTSSSPSSSSAPSSGATSPSGSSTSTTRRVRRLSKTKKSATHSLRRSSRKFLTAGKAKYAKRHTSSSSSKMRLVKSKIDKQHQERLAASKARVERLQQEREDLIAGNSQLAIMCETVTTNARSLRETYERQRAVYRTILTTLESYAEAEDEDDAGFIGMVYY